MIKVISLFAGAGGGDLGLEQAGLEIVFANDNDPACNRTYEANFGVPQWDYPIQYVTSAQLPTADVIVGGPPCQSFSNARSSGYAGGYRSADGLDNVYHMQRLIHVARPKLFVIENAPTLLQVSMIETLRFFKSVPGYSCDVYLISTEDCGIPQQRERVFIFGIRNDQYNSGIRFRKPTADHWKKYWMGWADYLNLPSKGILLRRASSLKGKAINEAAYTVLATEALAVRFSQPSHRIKGSFLSGERAALGADQRYLTIAEVARLQGFPSDFVFCGTEAEKRTQIGNAWSVPVGKAIGKEIINALKR